MGRFGLGTLFCVIAFVSSCLFWCIYQTERTPVVEFATRATYCAVVAVAGFGFLEWLIRRQRP
jgi:hypothetical protein